MSSLSAPDPNLPGWTFLTNHAHVLIAIARDPELRQRDIAFAVGITVGAVQRIIQDLETEGYLEATRVGRRNRYTVDGGKALRHPLEDQHTVSELINSLDQ
jgi:predicted transcriptional regulator